MIGELRSIEICAGGGGQALGLEQAGFKHVALVEIESVACDTLSYNRAHWNVVNMDLSGFDAAKYEGIDLLAGGVPCPPFSKAGKQLGAGDERDLFPQALRLVKECRPRAVLLENVKGLLDARFSSYRNEIIQYLARLGYHGEWRLLNASNFGVPQLRPRAVLVAARKDLWPHFEWPGEEDFIKPDTVGTALHDLMAANCWKEAGKWAEKAGSIAPTLVGGSKKHGGPDLGPTRARKAWAALSVDGGGLSDEPPVPGFHGMPRLTVKMTARIQGFPDSWKFVGRKTAAYRQIGNAFPPPVAKAVGLKIYKLLSGDYNG
jgi:DNA (cytosine-5)-methyltransferase 1